MRIKLASICKVVVMMAICVVVSSCSVPKDVAYFQDVDEMVIAQSVTKGQIKIEPFDKISIVVKSKDPALSELFNLTINSMRVGQTGTLQGGNIQVRSYTNGYEGLANYTVSPDGTIDFPVLGLLNVEGQTRNELASFIKGELMGKNLVKDPIVSVEFINMGFSVMGEVKSPGNFEMNKDKLSVLEALSLAGDLDIQGRRDNVTIIREETDGVHTYKVDLTNLKELTQSPAYYIKQGDVIYVEPNAVRKRQTTTNGNNVLSTGFWISVASLLTSVVTTIGVFVVK